MDKITYSTKEFELQPLIEDWFQLPVDGSSLYKIHTLKGYELFSREKDQSTDWHRIFYNKIRSDSSFYDIYEDFLLKIIKPRYDGEDIVYQRIPTFRVHMPSNIAVGEWHKDKFYRKKEWAERVSETNYYLPFTNTNESNTIWAESEEDKEDYSPMLLKYGECMEWDGSNLMHGNKVNDSDETRVSVDFRVMPRSRYVASNHETINTKTKFAIGGYYEII
ncbi:hypothetical protein CL634_04885 [bacterium]|nr:hypothetical protein [bacterium]